METFIKSHGTGARNTDTKMLYVVDIIQKAGKAANEAILDIQDYI